MSRNHPFSICPFLSPLSLALLTRILPVKGRPRAYRRRGIPLVPMSSPRGFWLCHRSSRLAAGCWASPYPLSLHSVSVILTLTHNQRQAGYGTQRRGLETTRTFVDNRPRSLRMARGLCSRHHDSADKRLSLGARPFPFVLLLRGGWPSASPRRCRGGRRPVKLSARPLSVDTPSETNRSERVSTERG